MSQEFPTSSLDIIITVYQFVSSSALGLKARVNKKGEFPPGGVPLCIIHVGGNSSTMKIYFSLCVNVLFFAKKKIKVMHIDSSAFN